MYIGGKPPDVIISWRGLPPSDTFQPLPIFQGQLTSGGNPPMSFSSASAVNRACRILLEVRRGFNPPLFNSHSSFSDLFLLPKKTRCLGEELILLQLGTLSPAVFINDPSIGVCCSFLLAFVKVSTLLTLMYMGDIRCAR